MGSVSTLLQVEPSHWKAESVCLNYLFCNISQGHAQNMKIPISLEEKYIVHLVGDWHLTKSEHVVCNLPYMT